MHGSLQSWHYEDFKNESGLQLKHDVDRYGIEHVRQDEWQIGEHFGFLELWN